MPTLITKVAGLLCLTLMGSGAFYAQKPSDKKEESIIIRKKGGKEEKTTIIIDGDNITVNGKPLDKFNDSSLEVKRFKEFNSLRFRNGRQAFGPEFSERVKVSPRVNVRAVGNRAVLGVITEKDEKGARIAEVTPESGAAKAGLAQNDIIIAINDSTVTDHNDLAKAVSKYKPEDKVVVTYLRNGKKSTVTATLGKSELRTVKGFHWNNEDGYTRFDIPDRLEFPRMEGFADIDRLVLGERKPRLGLQVQDTEDGNGLKVLEAGAESPAAKAGIEKDDIITGVNGKKIQSAEALREELKEVKEGETITVDILRGNNKKTVQVKFAKKLKITNL